MKCESSLILIMFLLAALIATGCTEGTGEADRQVVIYTSLDQRLSEPILHAYEEQTGVRVLAVYDTEATKTAGLVNRLLAEKSSPRADVFWNSEIVRTIVLKRSGVLHPYESPQAAEIPTAFRDPEGYWTGFAARARVIGLNTEILPEGEWPDSFDDLTSPEWNGRFAIAYPMFGTTSFHVSALFSLRGESEATVWLRRLSENGARIVDGNSTARDLVASGALPACFTDSDDIAVAIDQGKPVAMVVPDVEGAGPLLIPNTVALVAGGPNPEEGKAFIDYLLSPEVELALSVAPGAQIPLRPGLPWPEVVPRFEIGKEPGVDYEAVADHLEQALGVSRSLFVR